MAFSKRTAWFLIAAGVWSWVIWPTFLLNVWRDDRSWNDGPTGFLLVHLVLTLVSLAFATGIGWLGVEGVRPGRSRGAEDPTQFYRRVISLPADPGSSGPDSGVGGRRHRRHR